MKTNDEILRDLKLVCTDPLAREEVAGLYVEAHDAEKNGTGGGFVRMTPEFTVRVLALLVQKGGAA